MIYTAFLYAKTTRSNNVSEWKFFEAYRKGLCRQTHGPMLLLLGLMGKKKHTHTHTHNDNRESVRFDLINLEKLVGCHEE